MIRSSTVVFIVVNTLTIPATAADLLQVDWADKTLSAAREAKVDLLKKSNGFEASGGSEIGKAKLPVVGLLPAELGAVFATNSSGFESAPKVPSDPSKSDAVVVPSTSSSKLQYSISYQHIAEGLDAICSGTRVVRKLPKGLVVGDQTSANEGESSDAEVRSASAQQVRFGVPYKCDVYCSDYNSVPYCKTSEFADRMLSRAIILAPGNLD